MWRHAVAEVAKLDTYRRENVILDHVVFAIASTDTDLDVQFADSLASVKLDTEGMLIEWVTLRGDSFNKRYTIWPNILRQTYCIAIRLRGEPPRSYGWTLALQRMTVRRPPMMVYSFRPI